MVGRQKQWRHSPADGATRAACLQRGGDAYAEAVCVQALVEDGVLADGTVGAVIVRESRASRIGVALAAATRVGRAHGGET